MFVAGAVAAAAAIGLIQPWRLGSADTVDYPGKLVILGKTTWPPNEYAGSMLKVDPDNESIELIFEASRADDGVVSPDGRYLAWVNNELTPQVFLRDLQSGSQRRIGDDDTFGSGPFYERPALGSFSPDDSKLLVSEGYVDSAVFVVDVATGSVQRYPCAGVTQWHRFTWASSGSAYGVYVYEPTLRFDPQTGVCTTLPADGDRYCALAQTGTGQLLAVRGGELYRVDGGFGSSELLGELPSGCSYGWYARLAESPDGRYLAYEGDYYVYIVDLYGVHRTRAMLGGGAELVGWVASDGEGSGSVGVSDRRPMTGVTAASGTNAGIGAGLTPTAGVAAAAVQPTVLQPSLKLCTGNGCQPLEGDIANLDDLFGPDPVTTVTMSRAGQAALFSEPNFQGQCWTGARGDEWGYGNAGFYAKSVRVNADCPTGVVLCDGSSCQRFETDKANVDPLGQVNTVHIYGDGVRAALFSEENLQGRCTSIAEGDEWSYGNVGFYAKSVRVNADCPTGVVLCDGSSCQRFETDKASVDPLRQVDTVYIYGDGVRAALFSEPNLQGQCWTGARGDEWSYGNAGFHAKSIRVNADCP